MKKKTSYGPNFVIEEDFDKKASIRWCDHQGCKEHGEHRAPKSRDCNEYHWFCLDHVREYNAQWNYYSGMNQDEIESHQKADMTWQRPSWPLGDNSQAKFIFANRKIHDPFTVFKEQLNEANRNDRSPFHPESDENKALLLLDLEFPLEQKSLKARYKLLVKKYHPDHNPNDPLAEDRLKAINHAYSVLKKVVEVEVKAG